jgi:predicted DNA binding CopG/RHH family protein
MAKNHNRQRVGELKHEGPAKLTPEQEAHADAVFAAVEKEDEECRVNFRWGVQQLAIVKEVADLIGIPYQTYMKQVLFERAAADLAKFKNATSYKDVNLEALRIASDVPNQADIFAPRSPVFNPNRYDAIRVAEGQQRYWFVKHLPKNSADMFGLSIRPEEPSSQESTDRKSKKK